MKHRPRIALLLERELRPGGSHNGTVVLEARREVPVDWIRLRVEGIERAAVGGGNSRRTERRELLHLSAELSGPLSGPRTLPAGRTALPFRFELPAGLPPTYRGHNATTEYNATVSVSIPWWPDSRARFELCVGAVAEAAPEAHPLLFSSNPAGPKGGEPHIEGSLASCVFAPGGLVSGAFALSGAGGAWSSVRLAFVGRERVRVRGRTAPPAEAHRHAFAVAVDEHPRGEQVPFRFQLPDLLPPSWHSMLWSLEWELELRGVLRWRPDVRLRVPVVVVPRLAGQVQGRTFRAPPVVGAERIERIWASVAGELGLDHEPGALRGRAGETRFEVRREHRGRAGVFLVGELLHPSLHLDIEVRPFSVLRQMLHDDLRLGDEDWDGRHLVRGRDRSQIEAFGARVIVHLLPFARTTMDDDHTLVEIRDAGQSASKLLTFCRAVAELAGAVVPAGHEVPPPRGMEGSLAAWRRLATKLDGELETARMAVHGRLSGMAAEVRTEWSPEGKARRTLLALVPARPLPAEAELTVSSTEEGPAYLAGTPPRGAGARALVDRLLERGLLLEVRGDSIQLALEAPLAEPELAVTALGDMARLAAALRPGAGPFR